MNKTNRNLSVCIPCLKWLIRAAPECCFETDFAWESVFFLENLENITHTVERAEWPLWRAITVSRVQFTATIVRFVCSRAKSFSDWNPSEYTITDSLTGPLHTIRAFFSVVSCTGWTFDKPESLVHARSSTLQCCDTGSARWENRCQSNEESPITPSIGSYLTNLANNYLFALRSMEKCPQKCQSNRCNVFFRNSLWLP